MEDGVSETGSGVAKPYRSSPGRSGIGRVARGLVLFALFAAVLFVPAGRLDWAEAWVFLIFYFAFLLAVAAWGLRSDPDLMEERGRIARNVKSWDKAIMGVYTVLLFGLLVVAGLDAGRFRWSSVSLGPRLLGWLGLVLAMVWIWWVMSVNTYLSRMVRIQEERGHTVITTGPYRYVRHPMYLGTMLFAVCVPLVLGSWWALVPGLLIVALFVLRTALEDHALQQELPGYQEYTRQVRYRLVPGVW
jgi:protein-S-isoprenylcysteine O-methyltransferase Ste14